MISSCIFLVRWPRRDRFLSPADDGAQYVYFPKNEKRPCVFTWALGAITSIIIAFPIWMCFDVEFCHTFDAAAHLRYNEASKPLFSNLFYVCSLFAVFVLRTMLGITSQNKADSWRVSCQRVSLTNRTGVKQVSFWRLFVYCCNRSLRF